MAQGYSDLSWIPVLRWFERSDEVAKPGKPPHTVGENVSCELRLVAQSCSHPMLTTVTHKLQFFHQQNMGEGASWLKALVWSPKKGDQSKEMITLTYRNA